MELTFNRPKTIKWDNFFQLYKEPVITYSITPNNSPDNLGGSSDMGSLRGRGRKRMPMSEFDDMFSNGIRSDAILNIISGLFSKFYLPERVRLEKNGIRVKLSDVVSYKVVFQNETMKFYITVPKRWSKSFINAIKRDWGQVDITPISEDIVKFKPEKSRAIDIVLRHHHCLSIKYGDDRNGDPLYPALSSIGSTMSKDEKLMVNFNIKPIGEEWKTNSKKHYGKFKNGYIPNREEKSINGLISKVFEVGDVIVTEMSKMIQDLMGVEPDEDNRKQDLFSPEYSDRKLHANSKGYDVQISAIAESDEKRRSKHLLKNVESAFETLDGDNKFEVRHIRTKRGIKSIINSVENNKRRIGRGKDIFFEKEMNQLVRIPNRQTLKENRKLIDQDGFTRTEINEDFFKTDHNAQPLATTLDKMENVIRMPSYEREWWTDKGRLSLDKKKLDDNCQAWLLFGQQGSGKTSKIVRDICQTFGANIKDKEEWKKKSKSVVAFDVADGEILAKVWNQLPEWQRDRVIILNHSSPERPIPVNFSELEEFNRKVMDDPDYAYELAEMESSLVKDIIASGQSTYVDRWFTTSLQLVHMAHIDWGYAEAIRLLIDDDFRINEVMPKIHDEEMKLELETYNEMRAEGQANRIVETIENRFTQLKRDRKLWDCIAQKPLRNEDGECEINFRKWMDGDEDGAYLVLVYIPKEGISKTCRKFLFAHYFTKIWSVSLSREKGFAGREYRPETLVVVDEVHQIIDVPVIGKMFVDLFKEPRKYSVKLLMTLHGWSSIAKAGRTIENDIKQSILDNGCNLLMLRGGRDAFESLQHFLQPMTTDDYDNLMNMEWCGIFGVKYDSKYHVFQAKLPIPVDEDKSWIKYDNWDLYDLASYHSPYSRSREEVRSENLDRIRSMIKMSNKNEMDRKSAELSEDTNWEDLKK